MKKRAVSACMAAILLAAWLSGCGATAESGSPAAPAATVESVPADTAASGEKAPAETDILPEAPELSQENSAALPISGEDAPSPEEPESLPEEPAEESGGVIMQDTPDSTCFSQVGYSTEWQVLEVCFRDSGACYRYYSVPASVWEALLSAPSMGGYFNSDIKGAYDCEKLG